MIDYAKSRRFKRARSMLLHHGLDVRVEVDGFAIYGQGDVARREVLPFQLAELGKFVAARNEQQARQFRQARLDGWAWWAQIYRHHNDDGPIESAQTLGFSEADAIERIKARWTWKTGKPFPADGRVCVRRAGPPPLTP